MALDQKLYRPDDIVCECSGLLLVCNLVVPSTVTITESAAEYGRFSLANLEPFHDNKRDKFFHKK